jgi:hypothetical protein
MGKLGSGPKLYGVKRMVEGAATELDNLVDVCAVPSRRMDSTRTEDSSPAHVNPTARTLSIDLTGGCYDACCL